MSTLELTASARLKALLKNRYAQLAVLVLMLAGYAFAIVAGVVGSPVGSSNFSIVFVWIAWWAALILVAVPLLGRGWCSVCPIPIPGEWLQRGNVLGPHGRQPRWRGLRWPRQLRNIWLQSAAFLLLALFSIVLLTTPLVTAVVLGSMLVAATALGMVFQRRSFCRYLCPVGGFIGLYSQVAPVELRVKDKLICISCEGKPCYNGSARGYGCPWDVFPGGLSRNTYCGLCMECLRTCPHDNIAVNLRAFASDLNQPAGRLDEAFKSFVMLGSALIYSAVLLGPWGALKDAAYRIGSSAWFVYVVSFLVIICLVLPGLFALCASPGRDARAFRLRFSRLSSALIPLGLAAWIAFSLSFILTNGTYVLASLSDPLNLGWNLFGTSGLAWQPLLSAVLAPTQSLALTGGFVWSGTLAHKVASESRISSVPAMLYAGAVTLLLMRLLL